ncbi:hypothetical protein [Flavobacterium urocaniciphilum]|uniref:Lipoprotein n=1 Tax=Flavobacterium urocaniciphilum TaxID=1299341 RepID=A0A1H8Z5T2_9FLAO|nr:hypothetical protein [Flavobacterium urocaniciphilum]SEP59819.1 hypothetical protein SAMN05444005_101511 [Flavobacterium urocaniciphilum]
MKIKTSLSILILILTSCNLNNSTIQNDNYDKILDKKERLQLHKKYENIGTLISTIEFGIKATGEDIKDFEDGVIPWISIENPESEIDRLIGSDEIVVPFSEIILNIDYPLNNPASFVLKSSTNGFTKRELILEISKLYYEIYNVEENTSNIKTIPIEQRKGVINRNQTDGKYGIWGHDIGDLDLSSIEVYKTENGKIHIILIVES